MQLSKTEYLMFLKHPAWLWLKKHRKNLLPAPDAALQALFDAGHEYERYAERLFPEGIRLGFDNYREYQSLPERTRAALASGAGTIFQGRFENGQTTCIVDVLRRIDGDTFDLFEIKASSSVKDEHIPDLAFQVSVLEEAGLVIRKAGVIHVNRDYVRHGDIDVAQLSVLEDVTTQIREHMSETLDEIRQALDVMAEADMPDPSPRFARRGALGEWMEIHANIKGKPASSSIYNLAGITPEQIGEFEDGRISTIENIPDDADLNQRQRRQVAVTKSGRRHIEGDQIQAFLSGARYPLYFLDYETFSDVLPPFDGLRPYQQVPFQYSLHIIEKPGGPLLHREYLHAGPGNPVYPLLARMRDDIGDDGSVIVWYAPFETGRNRDMAEISPGHVTFLEGLNERVVDLMAPFQSGWFVDKDFLGSASIKKVLPVLVPELSYDGLAIADGEAAQQAWMDVFIRGKPIAALDTVLEELRKYCERDTLAMVRIYEVLRAL